MTNAGAVIAAPMGTNVPQPRGGPAPSVPSQEVAKPANANGNPDARRWGRFLRISFVVLVLFPTIAAGVYSKWIASPQYTSEALLAVRGSIEPSPNLGIPGAGVNLGGLAGILGQATGKDQDQDSFVLSSYVASLSLVEKLDKDGWLRSMFSRSTIDRFSALPKDASVEELWRYWNRQVTAVVDRQSGIVLLRILAFTPEDAQTIAKRVVAESEQMLNEMNERARADTVRSARTIQQQAEARYETALASQQEWRLKQGAVDPVQEAEAVSTNLLRLEGEKIAAERDLAALARLSIPSGPTADVLNDRIRALDTEIAKLKNEIGVEPSDSKTVVAGLTRYEETELERRFAETLLTIATNGLQDAERRARSQGVFVNVFVTPTLATESTGIRWWRTPLFAFMMSMIGWINAMLLLAVIRDHRR